MVYPLPEVAGSSTRPFRSSRSCRVVRAVSDREKNPPLNPHAQNVAKGAHDESSSAIAGFGKFEDRTAAALLRHSRTCYHP